MNDWPNLLVTEKMREVGGQALREECLRRFGTTWPNDVAWDFAEVAYRAIHAVVPAEPVSDHERLAITERAFRTGYSTGRLTGERFALKDLDETREKLARAQKLTEDCIELIDSLFERRDGYEARIAALKSELAKRPAAPVDAPPPALNPFRDFDNDRRRIGGEPSAAGWLG